VLSPPLPSSPLRYPPSPPLCPALDVSQSPCPRRRGLQARRTIASRR
jgi:hypothetical protein